MLKAFLDAYDEDVRAELAGADLLQRTGLPSGTLYPILIRFERAGLLTSRWESEDPATLGRPRRRFYQVTPTGVRAAEESLRQLEPRRSPIPGEA